jgi:hypothetical protein
MSERWHWLSCLCPALSEGLDSNCIAELQAESFMHNTYTKPTCMCTYLPIHVCMV